VADHDRTPAVEHSHEVVDVLVDRRRRARRSIDDAYPRRSYQRIVHSSVSTSATRSNERPCPSTPCTNTTSGAPVPTSVTSGDTRGIGRLS
jgi:hypothetical protein